MWSYNSLIVILVFSGDVFCYLVNQGVTKQESDVCLTPDIRLGKCVVIKNCPQLQKLLKTRGLKPETGNFLQRSQCGMLNNLPKVCCTTHTNSINAFVTSSSTPITSFSTSNSTGDVKKNGYNMIHGSSSATTSPSNLHWRVTSSPLPEITSNSGWNMSQSLKPVAPSVTTLFATNTSRGVNESKIQSQAKNRYALCGKSSRMAMNVIGGRNATLGDWPWVVALAYRTSLEPGPLFKCGGTLISDRWVLTASHCVQYVGNAVLTSVRIGDLNLNDNGEDGASSVHIPVDKIIPHHGFSKSPAVINDIALIRLKYPVTFTSRIRPICISNKEEHRGDEFYSKKSAYIAGWGNTELGGNPSSMLKEAQIDVIDRETCVKNYAGRMATIDQRVLCASRYGQDTCQGDSGGPLMMPIRASYYLIGIVSYGVGCGDNYFPGVYTKVAYFYDWIKSTTGIDI